MENKKKGHTPKDAPVNQEHITTNKTPTQAELLLDAWERGEKVSNADAILHYSIGHLASVISYMRLKLGIKGIIMTDEISPNGRRYVCYSMGKEDVKAARLQLM